MKTPSNQTIDTQAQQRSDELKQFIMDEIHAHQGFISFEKYMALCLYHPTHGYYNDAKLNIGSEGDFTTSPEICSLFGATLARHIQSIFTHLDTKNIVEFGAGSGKLAVDILQQLEQDNIDFDHYFIIETSPALRQRQQTLLATTHPELVKKISWINALPNNFEGVVLANEVCDAMPVHLIQIIQDQLLEKGVTEQGGALCWATQPIQPSILRSRVEQIHQHTEHTGYQTEINLNAEAWVRHLGEHLHKGAVFIIDYGYAFSEFYTPERDEGTLKCFFKHQTDNDPLSLCGLKDITAHIDFTALAETAFNANMDVSAFHSQSDFLLIGGITELAESQFESLSEALWLKQSAALKQLLLPGQMGEQFKVLSLTKNLPQLPRLSLHDRRYQL